MLFGRIKILPLVAVLLCWLLPQIHAADKNSRRPLTLEEKVIARSALLIDSSTGEILFERNIDEPHYPASVTKLLTALLTYEKTQMQGKFTIETEDTKVEPSSIPLRPGEEVSVDELMNALLICSANDAALALARHVAGNVPEFIRLMNERARQLGCTGSNFTNPNGLPDKNEYTTAADLMRIFRAVLRIPDLARIMEQPSITLTTAIGTQTHKNHNKLLGKYDGMGPAKTGWTYASQHTFAAQAHRGKYTLQLVILKSTDKWSDARALFDYGFSILAEREQQQQPPLQQPQQQPQAQTPAVFTATKPTPAPPQPLQKPPPPAPAPVAASIPPPPSHPVPKPVVNRAPEPKVKIIPYKIARGDTLFTIGQKHNIAIGDILRYNAIQDVNNIHPGIIIYLPLQVN